MFARILSALVLITSLSACVSMPPAHDYTAFKAANPASVIILPPLNNTPEVIAPYSVMTQLATPIAESGFYVFPVAMVNQTFNNNGLTQAADIQAVPTNKLKEIFGADTALYVTIDDYGTSYVVISSETRVTVTASLVDLETGNMLWTGAATASSAEQQNANSGGLVGMLVQAAVNQIFETVTDRGFDIAAITSARLLSAESYNGLLYGPRSPKYGQPVPSEKQK
ncbi:hypothetical protein AMBLS11_17510 [Alteromonas macleodii str. 'Black Sea 11']|uniref:DUF799 domain-containing protein n=1 Tax=Alteromonas abrolhosensis TaxID=1892904 RepID=UPI000286F32E|nr:hypothetical protein AMBLS11_17510 [Alteromonas macleodii str. 'Black Sea 11']NKW89095.1 DUF799 domain-containing protein [Alteromonadaceae bacterium A_SAG4]NKX03975.1 DUF799 domain-containing protein [Alteromonadaceae bacterium A_SAG6]NKX34805.1 DUF799 domain-containing protein [Alteromonadaceae bacterium A_SAG3]